MTPQQNSLNALMFIAWLWYLQAFAFYCNSAEAALSTSALSSGKLKVAFFQQIDFETEEEGCLAPYSFFDGNCYYDFPFKVMSAAGLLAAKHFNERNPAYVPEFGFLDECTIEMEFEIFNIPSNSRKYDIYSNCAIQSTHTTLFGCLS